MGKRNSLKERIIEVSWELFEEKGYGSNNDERHHRRKRGGERLFYYYF